MDLADTGAVVEGNATIDYQSFKTVFGDDRSLPDGVIAGQGIVSWQRFLTVLSGTGWRTEVIVDSQVSSSGAISVLSLFPESGELVTVKVFPLPEVQINVFPIVKSSIDFDFDTARIADQDACDALAAFVRLVCSTANLGQVAISHEGSDVPVLVFGPGDVGFRFI